MPSSINARTNAAPLTLELLREHVPAVKIGETANQKLLDPTQNLTLREKRELTKQKQEGTRSQEILIISALPLIKNIASKEFQRRKAWSSRISYDDVLQEAIAGFIRGLFSYKEKPNHTSPTNYLGMWITTSIRRRVEALEHDFTIPYEVIERARRIKAVTGRLKTELLRTPTDEELLEALNSNEGYIQTPKWRTSDKEKPASKKGPKFRQAHINEARNLANRSYHLGTYETPSYDSEDTYEKAGTPLTTETENIDEKVETTSLSSSRIEFFNKAFITMKIGSKQQDIILRYFGIGNYPEPQTQKEIITNTGFPPRFIKTVITTFSTYMPTKGGIFHSLVLETDPDLIESLEMSWLLPILGNWPDKQKSPVPAPKILTQTTTSVSTRKQ